MRRLITLKSMQFIRFSLLVSCILSTTISSAQRRSKVDNMSTEAEMAIQKSQDSMQRIRDSFEQNFDIRAYFQDLKKNREKKEAQQLNETLDYLKNLEPNADTVTTLTIQAPTLTILPDNIKSFKRLKSLTLKRCRSLQLADLFDKIKDLPTLRELHILFSDQTKLPENIENLKRIRILNLNGNKLSSLPSGISAMSALEDINFHNNILLDPNQAFGVLSKIKTLKRVVMSGCKIDELGENLALMTQIEELDLKTNNISSLTEAAGGLESLKILNLANNKNLNGMTTFYECSRIKNLEDLRLNGCGLKEISGSIATLKQIKKLDLRDNPIEKISSEIGALGSLEELSLGNNQDAIEKISLKSIPSELGKCKQLKKLRLRMAGLEDMPSSLSNLELLEYLDISWNQLKQFPEFISKLGQLKYLDVSRNKINLFPTQLGRLGNSLETLLFEGNFYSKYPEKINKIPQSITTLVNLKTLSLKDQVYEQLPENFWTSLTKMEKLNLSGALLQEIPNEIESMTTLKVLSLKGNELKSIGTGLKSLSTLEELDLSSNPDLNNESTLETIKQLTQLKKLDISYNEIKRQVGLSIKEALKGAEIVKREMRDSPEYEKPLK